MKNELFQELVKHLSQLVLVYRHLLDLVRKEKQLLLNADLETLKEITDSKEKMLKKIKDLENQWMATAVKIYSATGLKAQDQSPRLAEIATQYFGKDQEKLVRIRAVLNLLVQRTSAVNRQNETLTQSALSHVSGAMTAIKNTLNKKNSTYEKKGKRNEQPSETSGRLVSKEV